MLDFNRECHSAQPINISINELIERSVTPEANTRKYLGASAIGSECLRKIQFDWMVDPVHPARLRDIFARGHFFEQLTRNHLIKAGFKFAAPERLGFKALDGLFRGNADGILIAGPDLLVSGIRACGSTRHLAPRAGARLSATDSRKTIRNTPRKSRSIRHISRSPSIPPSSL